MLWAWVMTFLRSCSVFSSPAAGRGVDGVDLGGQRLNAALFVGFACVQGIQLPLDRDQLAVAAVILGEQIAVLGILIQQPQMQCRVCQALAVVLAVDGEQPRRNVPHHRRRGGMPLTRQLPLPSALISRYKSRSSVTS